MDVLPSAEFRKTYAKLTRPTIVTVNGHTIGRWTPSTPADDEVKAEQLAQANPVFGGHATSRPFTPAPKPSQRR